MFKLKKDQFRLICYLIVFCAIASFPVRQILAFEYPEIPPKEYFFETEIYDPYDPVRGRYVQLNFRNRQVFLTKKNTAVAGYMENCFAVLDTGKDGNAVITDLCKTRKEIPHGKDYLRVKYRGFHYEWDSKNKKRKEIGCHSIELPFQRFYMNEKLAPEAENLVREYTRGKNEVRLKVKIYPDGGFSVDDLFVKGRPIRELIRTGK